MFHDKRMCKPCLEDAEYAEQHKTERKENRDIDRMFTELYKDDVEKTEDSPQPWDTIDYHLNYYSDDSQRDDDDSDYSEDLEKSDDDEEYDTYPDKDEVEKNWGYRDDA